MEVSSSTTPNTTTVPKEELEPTKKVLESQEKQVTQATEKVDEETRQMNAQKTGVGNSVNLTA